MPYFLNVNIDGLTYVKSEGDGYRMTIKWAAAYPNIRTNKIAYNIYMTSSIEPVFSKDFFSMFPAFLSVGDQTNVTITDLLIGDMYHFGVRAIEYDPTIFNPTILPFAYSNLYTYPQSLLASDISATDTTIPLLSIDFFPPYGTIRIGGELILYTGIDIASNSLLVPGATSGSASLVDQGGGNFYSPNPSNIGQGVINDLTLVNMKAPTETWTIRCVEVLRNSFGQIIPNTARFSAVGSISGSHIDGYDYFWITDGVVVSNNILSFSITETVPFNMGDYFIVKVYSSPNISGGRGYNNTRAMLHNIDGYDGDVTWNPNAVYWPIVDESTNTHIYESWNRFDVGHYPFNVVDGYRQTTSDILTTDLTYSDSVNTGFPAYDYSGYHRTNPVLLLSGACIGSYIGGQQGCADGYNGVGLQVRGLNIQDANMQREEVLLSTTGEPVCLMQREWTGITCKCMLPYNEYPDARCLNCLGCGIVVGYTQFFDPRRSDGRIMVRFDPTVDDLVATDSGLESTNQPNCWTLPVPSLKDRSFIVRFDENDNEEFRYEILNVTRNKLLLNQTGAQKFVAQRVRKTDILYQVPCFRNTAMFPSTLYTSISSSIGIPPHSHTIVVNEGVMSITQINQLTGVSAGHNHVIRNGLVLGAEPGGIGHSHAIILP